MALGEVCERSSVRVSYRVNSKGILERLQENDYYPFGMKHQKSSSQKNFLFTKNNYKYQGQERQEELGLNWDSFKWRNYMPEIGRFFNIDPITEKYVDWAPYVFSGNRVVDSRELEGLEPEHFLSRFNKPKDLSIKVPSANAPLQQYYTVIKDSKVNFNDFKEKFNNSPQDILSNSHATFNSPVDGNEKDGKFKVGNYIKIDIHGPIDLPSYVKKCVSLKPQLRLGLKL